MTLNLLFFFKKGSSWEALHWRAENASDFSFYLWRLSIPSLVSVLSAFFFSWQHCVHGEPPTPIVLGLSYAYTQDFRRRCPVESVVVPRKNKVKMIKTNLPSAQLILDHQRIHQKVKKCTGQSILTLMGRKTFGYFSFAYFNGAQALKEESWQPPVQLSGFQLRKSKRHFSSRHEIIC